MRMTKLIDTLRAHFVFAAIFGEAVLLNGAGECLGFGV